MSDSVQQLATEHIQSNCGVKPPKLTKRHPKFCFDDDTLIAIQIEGTIFNVHKHQLVKSTVFSDMFAIAEESSDPQKVREGSLDHPIVMDNVSASDFECLMTVLYASRFSAHRPIREASIIIPAFRLANMWNFEDLCASLLSTAKRVLNNTDKIVFAHEFNVKEWLVPAYVKFYQRNKPPTTQEARKLGVDALLFISRLREERLAFSGFTIESNCANGVKRECGLGKS
ncbi:hypothetical protein FRC10_010310 [Ceratobasidium sp. 414]|nr:hypothetical protein FRC10_010310 [Ceratobasidium sp. 414]